MQRILLLLAIASTALFIEACIDVVFVVDSTDEQSLSRAVTVASDLADRTIKRSIVLKQYGKLHIQPTDSSAELIARLSNVTGSYKEYLNSVSWTIEKTPRDQTVVILLFSESEVPQGKRSEWERLKRNNLHIFRVGSAKFSRSLPNEGPSFNKLISCSAKEGIRDIRRRPPNEPNTKESIEPTTTERAKTQSMHSVLTTLRPRPLPTSTRSSFVRRRLQPTTASNRATTNPPPTLTTVPRTTERSTTRFPTSRRPYELRLSPTTRSQHRGSFALITTTTTTSAPATTKFINPGCIADVLLLVDFSHGTGDNTEHYFDIAASAIGTLPIEKDAVRVGMVGYSGPGRAKTMFQLNKHFNKDSLIEELFKMAMTGGTTRTADALKYAVKELGNQKHGARKGAKKTIIVFTDGYSQDDPFSVATDARQNGIQLIAVATDGRIPPDEAGLRAITGKRELVLISPKGHIIREKILGRGCPM